MNTKQFITASILTAFTGVVLAGVFQYTNTNNINKANAKSANDVPLVHSQVLGEPSAERLVIETPVQDNAQSSGLVAAQRTPDGNTIQAPQVAVAKTIGSSATSVATTAPTIQTAYSAQQAANIARSAAQKGDALTALSTPELVHYAGKLAYEVVFAQGHVYVDANTGTVLANAVAMTNDKQQGRGEGDDENHDSHSKKHHGKKGHHDDGDDD